MHIRVNLNEENKEKFESLEKTLAERGKKNFDKSVIINEALNRLKSSYWNGVADDLTPLEWKFRMALEDEKTKKDLEKILNSMKFEQGKEVQIGQKG